MWTVQIGLASVLLFACSADSKTLSEVGALSAGEESTPAAASDGPAPAEDTGPIADAAEALVFRRAEITAAQPGPVWTLREDEVSRTNLVSMAASTRRHVHPDARHTLVVLEGSVVARPGSDEIELLPGDFISIPAGLPHNYRVPEGTALLMSFDAPAYDPTKTINVAEDAVDPVPTEGPQDSTGVVVIRRAEITASGGPVWTLHADGLSRTNLVNMAAISPSRHYHPDASHTLMILEGQLTAFPGDQEVSLTVGDYISIPAGLPHHYQVPEGVSTWAISGDAPAYDPSQTVQLMAP